MGKVCLLKETGLVMPINIEGPISTGEVEADATRGESSVQDADGGLNLRVGDISPREGSVIVDHMP